jgi:hypothetical protein
MRALRLTSPLAHGDDVRKLQQALNARGHGTVAVDGQYGPNTDHLARHVGYLLGLNVGPTLSPYVQRRIINPKIRNPIQRARARARLKAYQSGKGKVERVLAWERARVGIVEHPANSNRGPQISQWQRDVAGIDGQPWCGAFQGYALKHVAGIPIPGGVVYTPNIISYAKTATGGFASWHPWGGRKPGDLILFKWPGVSNAACDHVGILDSDGQHTIEGNTSSDDGGSQNNGGGVYRRERGPRFVVGCARPRY